MVIEVDQVLKCKQLHGKGMSFRGIARELRISRTTVRKYVVGEAEPTQYRRSKRHSQRVRDQVRERIQGMLQSEKDRETPRKQRLTSTRIHRILVKEGLELSKTSVWRVVKELRLTMRDPLEHSYLTLEYTPGQDAQVDFFEAVVDSPTGERSKVFVLLVRACFSARTYAYVAPNQSQEALFEGLTRSFEFFGGVFQCLWFDNLTPVVQRVLEGRNRKLQKRFATFQAHYGFRAEFCAPGKGHEKGGVEGEVKYSRHQVLSPIPIVEGRAELQKQFDEWMVSDLERTVRGKSQTIADRWSDEVAHLLPLPQSRFEAARHVVAKVSPRSWIQYGTCYYSAPVKWVGFQVELKVSAEEVAIFSQHEEIARHPRVYGQGHMTLELEHYLPLLKRKPRGLDRACVVRRWLRKVPACWRLLLQSLRQVHGEVAGSRDFVEVLRLGESYGVDRATGAVRRALRDPRPSLELVRYFLFDTEVSRPPKLESPYDGPKVDARAVDSYLELCNAQEVSCV